MEGIAKWGPRLERLQKLFSESLMRVNPDFQMQFGYEVDPPLKANYALCSNQIAERFDCLAVTFEMPFKDCINSRGVQVRWLNEEAEKLGASIFEFLI